MYFHKEWVNPAILHHAEGLSQTIKGNQEQYATKIFQVFQRLHHEKDIEGTGIGLAI